MCTEGPNVLSQDTDKANPSEGGAVYANIDDMTNELERLDEVVRVLGEKIYPILRDDDGTVPESSEAIDPNSSTLALSIAHRTVRIREMRRAVTDLISRIDL